jgi:uncharacterized membrane protein YdjX (TVP38/TMEM64 family)
VSGAGGKRRRAWPAVAALAVAAVAAWWLWRHPGAWEAVRGLDWARLKEAVRAAGAWGPLALVALDAVVVPCFLPSTLVTVLAAALYGAAAGAGIALAGLALGMATPFLLARRFGTRVLPERWRDGDAARKLQDRIAAEGWKIVLVVRLVPINPFPLMNYLFGLTAIRFWPYLAASVAGVAPITAVYAFLAASAAGMASGEVAVDWRILAGLCVASAALACFFWWPKRKESA